MNGGQKQRDGKSEHGGAGVKLIILLVFFALVAHAGYNYVPVAYDAQNLESEMQTAVTQGMALYRNQTPVDSVKSRVLEVMKAHTIPADAVFRVQEVNGIVQASLKYSITVNLLPFGLYQYEYVFDKSMTPSGFLIE